MTRIVCISDTHANIGKFDIPDGDILLHAGDITMGFAPDAGTPLQLQGVVSALAELPHKHKVFIAGNHDRIFQGHPDIAAKIVKPFEKDGVVYLQDSSVEIDGLKIYGSPWQPWFYDWAFNFPDHNTNKGRARAFARDKWDEIPDDIDVLITHGPPHGVLDRVPSANGHVKVGCRELWNRVSVVKPKLHVFGHIHVGHGETTLGGVHYVNAAIVNNSYKPANAPIIVDI